MVVSIGDGVTLAVLDNGQQMTIQLANIDAPEKVSPLARSPNNHFPISAGGRRPSVRYRTPTATDGRWQRFDAMVWRSTESRFHEAWRGVYPKYNKGSSLPEVQQWAKEERLGSWLDED